MSRPSRGLISCRAAPDRDCRGNRPSMASLPNVQGELASDSPLAHGNGGNMARGEEVVEGEHSGSGRGGQREGGPMECRSILVIRALRSASNAGRGPAPLMNRVHAD